MQNICETEMFSQDKFKIWNLTFSGKQFKTMMHNYFSEILAKIPTADISTEVMKQQYEHIFLYCLMIYIGKHRWELPIIYPYF